jgi:outer membrane protein OmpA-like peptidoglycan-associated protein
MLEVLIASFVASGCMPSMQVSPELENARDVVAGARHSSAYDLDPDDLAAAERSLALAEAAEDGSAREIALAYIADRQTRIALSRARRAALESARATAVRSDEPPPPEIEAANGSPARDARMERALDRVREYFPVREEDGRTRITLNADVLFAPDRDRLRPEARSLLLGVADALRASRSDAIVIEGHTGSKESEASNCRSSNERVLALYEYFVGQRVDPDRLHPIPVGDAGSGGEPNDRVEIVIGPVAFADRACSLEES